MEQPDVYVAPGKENWVCRLEKGQYGASNAWNEELNTQMEGLGYITINKDPAVYVKSSWNQADFVAGGLWVDDVVGIGCGREFDAF